MNDNRKELESARISTQLQNNAIGILTNSLAEKMVELQDLQAQLQDANDKLKKLQEPALVTEPTQPAE